MNLNQQLIHMEAIQTQSPALTFEAWIEELAQVTARETGMTIERARSIISRPDAKTWYDDGFTPFATFRETYNNENDSDL
jgi:hypothetical protein